MTKKKADKPEVVVRQIDLEELISRVKQGLEPLPWLEKPIQETDKQQNNDEQQ